MRIKSRGRQLGQSAIRVFHTVMLGNLVMVKFEERCSRRRPNDESEIQLMISSESELIIRPQRFAGNRGHALRSFHSLTFIFKL